jgi:site-specific recombinase XerD
MKYSVILLLYPHRPNDKGQFPIYIRITINRKQSYLSTGYYLEKKYWDPRGERVKDGHMLAGTINADITTRKQIIIKKIVDYQVKGQPVTAAAIKAMVAVKNDLHNVFEFAELFIKEIQHKRESSTLVNYKKHLNTLESYHGSRSLAFEEITHEYLVEFEDYLRRPVAGGRKGLNGNYIHSIWKFMKTFFNAARKRGIITCYPFATYENPDYKAPAKDYLTIEELDQLEKLVDETSHPVIKQTVTYFLLGCYSGLRLSDWRRFNYDKRVAHGRLYLHAKKNGERIMIPVVGRLERHLQRVKVVDLKISEREINRTLKNIAGIKKKISSHTGRHTFAITMCAERGVSLEVCATLMGITVAVCEQNYYSVTPKKIEDEIIGKWVDV